MSHIHHECVCVCSGGGVWAGGLGSGRCGGERGGFGERRIGWGWVESDSM